MKVTLNGQPRDVPQGCTLEALLRALEMAPDALATAVNDEFVPRTARAAQVLHEGDVVMCFQPITGG